MATAIKFNHLRAKCKRIAFEAIQALIPIDENYEAAWAALDRTFENRFVAMEVYLDSIRNFPMTDPRKPEVLPSFCAKLPRIGLLSDPKNPCDHCKSPVKWKTKITIAVSVNNHSHYHYPLMRKTFLDSQFWPTTWFSDERATNDILIVSSVCVLVCIGLYWFYRYRLAIRLHEQHNLTEIEMTLQPDTPPKL